MKNKAIFVLTFTLFLIPVHLFPAAPKWITSPEKAYPVSEYVRSIGEGDSLKTAESAAVASISMVFQTKTNVRTVAKKELSYIQEENRQEYTTSQQAVQVVNISSDTDFFLLQFEEPYFDKKENRYYVLAYIKRNEAENIYNERISHVMSLVNKLYSAAGNAEEVFWAVSNYQKALALAELAEAYIKNVTIINPKSVKSYEDDYKLIEAINKKLLAVKPELTFTVECNDDRCMSVENHVISLLEQKGFIYSEKDYKYKIDMNLRFAEESYDSGEFVRPTAKIQIKNNNGNTIKSYSKSYTRYGAKTMSVAYTRSFLKIQEDLTQNFLSEF